MKNSFIYSDNYKRYYTLDYYFKKKFNEKVFKISLDAGFTCPNIDGKKGVGGCIYCSPKGSGDFAGNKKLDIQTQFFEVKEKMQQKWKKGKYIAYFQAFTNTYAPLEKLKNLYESTLLIKDVVGISIATRPDCIEDELYPYLEELSKKTFLIVELGLQTIHEETSKLINRCHNYKVFYDCYQKLKKLNINVCVHIINGLPYETREMMIQTVQEVSKLLPHSVKIHMLHVLKNTKLAIMYKRENIKLLSLFEYVNLVCDQIELLPPTTVIQRLTGDGGKNELIAPLWTLKKFVVINEIDKELKRRNSFQGTKYLGNKNDF